MKKLRAWRREKDSREKQTEKTELAEADVAKADMEKIGTVGEWLKWAKTVIPSLDAEVIAVRNFAAGRDRSWLVTHQDKEILSFFAEMAQEMVQKRAEGMPLAYVLGVKEFYGRNFKVTPDVLIPRPETEELIDLVKELDLPAQVRFLDVGTGSGCIAVTLALEFPQADVCACDLSTDALDVAERNDAMHEARIQIRKSDLLRDLMLGEDKQFDVIVANLPYVNPAWDWLDLESLEAEPTTALFALNENGLSIYHRLFDELAEGLASTDYLVLEADPCQHKDLVKLAGSYGWRLEKSRGYGLVFVGAES